MMVNKPRIYRLLFLLLPIALLTGCIAGPYFQKVEPIPHDAWDYNFKPTFTFAITDTNANYEPSFLIQHTQAYPYCNLWMWVYVKYPDSSMHKQRVNVTLADANGKWLGRGMGEIWEQRMKLSFDSIQFRRAGTYQVTLEQNMRINPLPEILHVGLRVEKVTPRMQ